MRSSINIALAKLLHFPGLFVIDAPESRARIIGIFAFKQICSAAQVISALALALALFPPLCAVRFWPGTLIGVGSVQIITTLCRRLK